MQFAWGSKRFGLESLRFICSCTIFAGFWNLDMQFAYICMVFKAVWPWPASVLRRGLSLVFCDICNEVSFRIYFRLV